MSYKRLNRIFGWVAFLIAAIVYLMTIEPTVSFWDCGEFIASGYKLEVGHPPGAPTFMLFTRAASLFAPDASEVARMVNSMSALASAFTIMFLFWTIAYFAKRIIAPDGKLNNSTIIAILGSSMVGAMAYTFSDTFWFSAVEGEVYATSSLFTAVVFWAMIRWEQAIDTKHALRWLFLIALLMGLSIGVHLLNLLAIPAIALIYYFKKYKPSGKGIFAALVISALIVASIMFGIVPGVAKVAFNFDLMFVNTMGLSYFSGVLVWLLLLLTSLFASIYYTQYKNNKNIGTISILLSFILLGVPFMGGSAFLAVVIIAGLGYGIWKLYDKHKSLLNTIMLAITFILIGYSTFSIILIRSLADPPMDQNNPDNMYQFLSYLNREQYGDRPLFFGQYYNSEAIDFEEGKPVYLKKNGKYEVVDHKTETIYKDNHETLFPRMWSPQKKHIKDYKQWAGIKGDNLPTYGENLKFFFKYQLGWMYWRYFMWNFAGRQNDIQGHGNTIHGNWISGIPAFDTPRVGDQSKLPDHLKNEAHNKYYMLPLLLGLIGLFFQLNKNQRDWWIVMILFLFTGIAVVFYLNQYPHQPRERDYAYVGSFYVFSIWLGLGALAVYNLFKKGIKGPVAAILSTLVGLLIPAQMASQNWDDHDRSGRAVAHDYAHNYLKSCEPNSILFTNGDNDTFPIWYAQEVEGFRTDVKVCCLPYVASNWYIDQMQTKTYEAEPMPFSLSKEKYEPGKRDVLYHNPVYKKHQPVNKVMNFIANDRKSKIKNRGQTFYTYPAKKFILPVDSANAVNSGIVKPGDADKMKDEIRWNMGKKRMFKNQMMVLDMLNNFDWNRPVYYTSIGHESTLNLDKYFQLDGFSYRLTPIKSNNARIDTDLLYKNLMEDFKYGNIEDKDIYADHYIRRTTKIVRIRHVFTRLAKALLNEGDTTRAVKVLDRAEKQVPMDVFVPDMFSVDVAVAWYRAGEKERGDAVIRKISGMYDQAMGYHSGLSEEGINANYMEIAKALQTINECYRTASRFNRKELVKEVETIISTYQDIFQQFYNYQNRKNR